MSWVAVATIGSGLIAGGASAYGASQTPEGVKSHEIPVSGANPGSDPLLSALSMNALLGLGGFDANIARQAGPAQQLYSQALSSGQYNSRQLRYLQSALAADPAVLDQAAGLTGKARNKFLKQHGLSKQAVKGIDLAMSLARTSGYDSLGAMFAEQAGQADKLAALQAQYAPVAERIRAGTLASQGRIGDYLGSLPNLLTGEANPFTKQLREEALITSQKYGVNPYNMLEQADALALQRALSLISGEQSVLAGQAAPAQQAAGLRTGAQLSAAQLGGAQAQTLANAMLASAQMGGQQAQAWGDLGGTLGAFGLIGADMLGNRGPAAGRPS